MKNADILGGGRFGEQNNKLKEERMDSKMGYTFIL